MTFPLEHSSVLCAVIKHCMQSCKRTYGRINWEEVASKFNGELIGYDLGNAVVYSDIDCHNHWKYLAYGGSKNREALLSSSQDHCNSDEETFYLYPQQAIDRHQRVIAGAAGAVAESVCSINAANESDLASDVNTLNVSSPSPILTLSTATILFEGGNCGVSLSGNNCTDSSSDGVSCDSNMRTHHPHRPKKEHDSGVTNNQISSGVSVNHQFLGLLSHPGKQPWRRTKLLVPSQIDGGLASMQNITFTESKDPFCKTSNQHSMGLCQSLMAENPLYQQFRKSKGGRPPSNHPNQCTQSNSTGTGSVGLSSIGAVNTQYQSNIDPPAVAASSSSMLAASSSSQMSEKLNSLRHDGQDDGIERSEPTSEVILSESYSATAHSSSSSNRYSAMSGDRYQVPPIAPHLVTEKSSNGLLQKTQKYRRKKSENQTVTQLQQKVDLLNYNQQELLQHQQLLKEEYERNLRQLHPLVQQKQQHQYYQEQQQIQSEHHGSGNRQNHQQLQQQQQQQQQLLSMHPPHTTSSISTNGRFIEGEISPVVKQNSHISQTEGIARMQVFNHNRSNFITSSTSSSNRESISISCDEESIGNDCVLRSERGSLTAGCTADVNRNNTTAARLLPDCDHHSNPTHFAVSAYHQELHPNLNQKIDQTADRINLSIRAHSEVECNAAQSRTADVSQDLLFSNMKPDNEQERKRKREKLQYVNYVKKSRDAVKSLHETSVHHNISAFGAGLNIGSNRMINSADNGSGGCQSIFSTKFSGNGNRGISSDRGVEQIDRSSSHSDSIDLHSPGRHSSSATSISHYPSLSASESLVQTIIPYVPLIGGGISNGSRAQIIESTDGNKCDICDDDKSNHYNRTIDSKLVYISSHDPQNCNKSSSAHNPASFGSSAGGSNGASVRDHASASDMEVTAMLLAMSGKGSGFSNSHTLLPSLLPGHSLPVNTSRCSAYPSISHNDPIFRVDSQQYRSMPSSSSRLRDGSLSGAMATTSASSPNSYLKIDVSGSKSDDEFCSQPL